MVKQASKWIGLVHIGFGLSIAMGCIGELVVSFVPGLLPEASRQMYTSLHSPRFVQGWVIVQSLLLLPAGVGFVVAGSGVMRQKMASLALARKAALATMAVCVASQVALGFLLYPSLLNGSLSIKEPFPGFWLFSLLSAGLGAMMWPLLVLFVYHKKKLLSGTSTSSLTI